MGRAILDILKSQFKDPENPITATPSEVGNIMVSQARKELQGDKSEAYDVVQEFLTYIIKSKYDFTADTEKGSKGAKNWQQALRNIYNNVRRKAISVSKKRFRETPSSKEESYAHLLWQKEQSKSNPKVTWTPDDQKKLDAIGKKLTEDGVKISEIEPQEFSKSGRRNKSIDEAFGTSPEGGGPAEGGEGKLSQPEDSWLGTALDDQKHAKDFFSAIDSVVPRLRQSLPPEQRILFDVIYEDEEGGFGSNIDENMNQSRSFIERAMKEGNSDIAARVKKRPGLLTELRAKLLTNIRKFVESNLSKEEFNVLEDEFLSDVSLDAQERSELDKLRKKYEHWRGIDERKRQKILDDMKSGKDVDPKELDKIQNRIEIQDEFGRLEYVMGRRKLTKQESRRYNEIISEFKKREMNYNAIPPIPYDLGEVDVLAKLKWLEENDKLTPEQDELMDEVWDSLLDQFPADIVESIEPMKPKAGEKVASLSVRLAMKIVRNGVKALSRHISRLLWMERLRIP